ncbi:hypothetical protein SAMN05660776_2320 [Salegentibacter holothuriorum]|uniref:YhhN-like protein n=1 Tax=Salegentibacter holothuriorum TaxID=241145 RepID=A0A1T5D237_9FLAO|nr:hypothetical protein [Salegentibacter holothuriorum]SKB65651.1 hypothetical protein SAMN05660776_2320 [Salegentibacter holothuriorum]
MANSKNLYNSKFIIASTVFWVIINLLGVYFLDEEDSRWLRVASSLYFVIWSFTFGVFKSKIDYVLVSYLICDISLVYYEIQISNFITFIARSLIFSLLIFIVFPKIRSVKFKFFELMLGIAVVAINIYLLIELLDMVPKAYLYDSFYPAYLMLTGLTMLLVVVAFTYNNRFSSKRSFYFLLAALFLALSDVNFFIAFYLEVPVFNYPDRFFHVFALGLLLLFWIKPLENNAYNNLDQREV